MRCSLIAVSIAADDLSWDIGGGRRCRQPCTWLFIDLKLHTWWQPLNWHMTTVLFGTVVLITIC